MQKFIAFTSLSDLEAKLDQLKNIIEENKKATTNFLLIKNIPFQELEGDGIGADLSSTTPEVMKEYLETFGEMNNVTMKLYQDLGIVYVSEPSTLETDMKLAVQFNLKTRCN